MTFHSSQSAWFLQEHNSSSALPFPFEFYVPSLLFAGHQSTHIQATPHFYFLWWPWSSSSGQSFPPRGMWWDGPLPWSWKPGWLCTVLWFLPPLWGIPSFPILKQKTKMRQSKTPRIWTAWSKLNWSLLLPENFTPNASDLLLIHIAFSYTTPSLSSLFSSAGQTEEFSLLIPTLFCTNERKSTELPFVMLLSVGFHLGPSIGRPAGRHFCV